MSNHTFRHEFSLRFFIESRDADAADIDQHVMRAAVLRRLADLPGDEILEAVGPAWESVQNP